MAVLFRNASHSYELELILQTNHIPFTKYGGRKFLESAHVKGLVAFLRSAVNPFDSISLKKILQNISGIGSQTAENIIIWIQGSKKKLASLTLSPVSSKIQAKLQPLETLMDSLTKSDELISVEEKVRLALDYYNDILPDLFPDDYPSRQSDLAELLQVIHGETLEEAISLLTLDPPSSTGAGRTDKGRPIDLTLSTIHSAKGLEWGAVFLLSAVEGRFPGSFVKGEENIEEERRLLYVALTRAKDELHIFMPQEGMGYDGQTSYAPNRFLLPLCSEEADGFLDGQKTDLSAISVLFGQEEGQGEEQGEGKDRSIEENCQPSFHQNRSVKPAAYPSGKRLGKPLSLKSRPKNPEPVRVLKNVAPKEKARLDKIHEKTGPPPPADPNYRPDIGHRVAHPVFGTGLVIKRKNDIVTIDFEQYGRKNINLTYVRFRRILN
jgi:hypothetical protein